MRDEKGIYHNELDSSPNAGDIDIRIKKGRKQETS
jgi:hypothetical protein